MGKPMIITELQLLRALAAVLVVICHAITRFEQLAPVPLAFEQFAISAGKFGVYVFFVISGFIIMRTANDQFGEPNAPFRFAWRRILRIVPIYWIATLAEVAWRAFRGNPPPFDEVLMSLAFIPYPSSEYYMRPVLGVGWTLNYEMFFYLVFALCLALPRRFGLRALFAALLAFVAIGILWNGTQVYPFAGKQEAVTRFEFWTSPILLLFLAGVVLGSSGGIVGKQERAGLSVGIANSLLLAIIVGITLLTPAMSQDIYPGAGWVIVQWLAAIVLVMIAISAHPWRNRSVSRWIERAGDASYSTYLFHFFFILLAEKIWLSTVGPRDLIGFVVFASLLGVFGGVLAYVVVEQPTTRALRRWVAKPSSASMTRSPLTANAKGRV